MSNTINADILRVGFFGETTPQWFHIVNIKILDENDNDIAPSSTFTPTSTSKQYQSPGNLKDILTDNNETTFSHSEFLVNSYIKIDFGKTVAVKQILVENRVNNEINKNRIINAQFMLSDAANKTVFLSDKIKVADKFYYLNMNSPIVNAGLPLIADAMKAVAAGTKAIEDAKAKSDAILKALNDSKVAADTKDAVVTALVPVTALRDAVVADAIKTSIDSGATSPEAVAAAAVDVMKQIADVKRDEQLNQSITNTLSTSASSVSPATIINNVTEAVNKLSETRDKDLAEKIVQTMATSGKTVNDVVNAAIDSLQVSTEKSDEALKQAIDISLSKLEPIFIIDKYALAVIIILLAAAGFIIFFG